jgi:hypothetical protein
MRSAKVIYLWQQPAGQSGQCGGQGQGCGHTLAHKAAKSINTNIRNEFIREKMFRSDYERPAVSGGFQ